MPFLHFGYTCCAGVAAPSTKERRLAHMNERRIQEAINQFKFRAKPSNANHSTPATVGDIHKLIDETEKLIIEVVNAMKS